MGQIDVQLSAHLDGSDDAAQRYVNTLQFVSTGDASSQTDKLQALLDLWAQRTTLGWGDDVDTAIGAMELRAYNMSDVPPREPLILTNTVAGATVSGEQTPAQVALCLSFYATRNIPKQRGRIYLGPLTSSGFRPSTAVRDAAIDIGQAIGALNDENWAWVCGSAHLDVTNLWVNDVWDTQRRRVPDETTRTLATV